MTQNFKVTVELHSTTLQLTKVKFTTVLGQLKNFVKHFQHPIQYSKSIRTALCRCQF